MVINLVLFLFTSVWSRLGTHKYCKWKFNPDQSGHWKRCCANLHQTTRLKFWRRARAGASADYSFLSLSTTSSNIHSDFFVFCFPGGVGSGKHSRRQSRMSEFCSRRRNNGSLTTVRSNIMLCWRCVVKYALYSLCFVEFSVKPVGFQCHETLCGVSQISAGAKILHPISQKYFQTLALNIQIDAIAECSPMLFAAGQPGTASPHALAVQSRQWHLDGFVVGIVVPVGRTEREDSSRHRLWSVQTPRRAAHVHTAVLFPCSIAIQFEPLALPLFRHNSQSVVSAALRAVGNIVTGDDIQTQVILNSSALPCLCHLLSSSKESIRKEACWTISNITAGNRNQIQVRLTLYQRLCC